MGLYIEKEMIESTLDFHHNVLCDIPFGGDTFIDFLGLENFVEAEPVTHAKWRIAKSNELGTHVCTSCGRPWHFSSTLQKYICNYCPQCGARIDDTTYLNIEEDDT